MKKTTFLSLSLLMLFALLTVPTACFYDNEEDLYGGDGGSTCDTTAMSYANDILPILQANCYSCHTEASNVSGNPFDTYAKLKNYVNAGRVVARINDPTNPMPPTGLLPQCDRDKIEAWVNAGAPNN